MLHLRRTIQAVGIVFFVSFYSSTVRGSVEGTKHDMYFAGKGVDTNVCGYCHKPHLAAGSKIWSDWANEAQLSNGPSTVIGNMCYTCHDGTVTSLGQATAFNSSLQQHSMPAGTDCDQCHDPHDSVNGRFMKVPLTQDSYCAGCHNSTVNAGGLGDHTGAGNHTSYWSGQPAHNTGAACAVCHAVDSSRDSRAGCYLCHARGHGGVNDSAPGVSKPILRRANTNSAYCAECHPVNVSSGSGNYLKHPANLADAGNWGTVECARCHDVHQPENPTYPALLKNQNLDSGICTECHQETSETNGPKIGGGSHPVNVPLTMTPIDPSKSPVGNTIDDDDVNGPDYPANSSNLVCETCHSVHRKGIESGLFRDHKSDLCKNCHP